MNTTAQRTKALIAHIAGLGMDDVADGKHLTNDLHLDSMDRFELTMEIEDEFCIEIPDEEAVPLNTVGEIVALVERKTLGVQA